MLLHSPISQSPVQHRHVSLSISLSSPSGFRISTFLRTIRTRRNPIARCSISQVHSYGTVDYERRRPENWNSLYKRISSIEDPKMDAAGVLNQWAKEGKSVKKYELFRVVQELRKYKRYKPALEVYEWMNNRAEMYKKATSDIAIHLDLIAKVNGVLDAEAYFLKLQDRHKDTRTYGSLLHAYAHAKMGEKAESLFETMKHRCCPNTPLSFNVMMTLHRNLEEYDKVDLVVSEMQQRNIRMDIFSYNIWLSSCGARGSVEKMEQVFEQMKLEVNPNWTTFCSLATMYSKVGQLEKVEDCLKKAESRITGRDRWPYHHLITLYGNVGNKEEVYRVWNIYKSTFPSIPHVGYNCMMSSLVRLDDVDGAVQLYEEWMSVKSTYDPFVPNTLMRWYVRNGHLEKSVALFDQFVEAGGKPNRAIWATLAEGHIREERISEALSCLQKAVLVEGSKNWRPKPALVSTILKICEQENDMASKDVLVVVLKQLGCSEDEVYMTYMVAGDDLPADGSRTGGEGGAGKDGDEAELLLNPA